MIGQCRGVYLLIDEIINNHQDESTTCMADKWSSQAQLSPNDELDVAALLERCYNLLGAIMQSQEFQSH
jgi:hypothetical protein